MHIININNLNDIQDKVEDILSKVKKEKNSELAQMAIDMYRPLQELKKDIILDKYENKARGMFQGLYSKLSEEYVQDKEIADMSAEYIYTNKAGANKADILLNDPENIYNNFYVIPVLERKTFDDSDINKINNIQKRINEVMFTNYHDNFLKQAHRHNKVNTKEEFDSVLQKNYITSLKALALYDSTKNDAFMPYLNGFIKGQRKTDSMEFVKFKERESEYIDSFNHGDIVNNEKYVSQIQSGLKDILSGSGMDAYMDYIDKKLEDNPNLTEQELQKMVKNDFDSSEANFINNVIKKTEPEFGVRVHTHNLLAGHTRAQYNDLNSMVEFLEDKLPNEIVDNLVLYAEGYTKNNADKRLEVKDIKKSIERRMNKDPILREHLESMAFCYEEEQEEYQSRG